MWGVLFAGSCHAADYEPQYGWETGDVGCRVCGVMLRCGLRARSTAGRQAMYDTKTTEQALPWAFGAEGAPYERSGQSDASVGRLPTLRVASDATASL
jgi:hypothetical protein